MEEVELKWPSAEGVEDVWAWHNQPVCIAGHLGDYSTSPFGVGADSVDTEARCVKACIASRWRREWRPASEQAGHRARRGQSCIGVPDAH